MDPDTSIAKTTVTVTQTNKVELNQRQLEILGEIAVDLYRISGTTEIEVKPFDAYDNIKVGLEIMVDNTNFAKKGFTPIVKICSAKAFLNDQLMRDGHAAHMWSMRAIQGNQDQFVAYMLSKFVSSNEQTTMGFLKILCDSIETVDQLKRIAIQMNHKLQDLAAQLHCDAHELLEAASKEVMRIRSEEAVKNVEQKKITRSHLTKKGVFQSAKNKRNHVVTHKMEKVEEES